MTAASDRDCHPLGERACVKLDNWEHAVHKRAQSKYKSPTCSHVKDRRLQFPLKYPHGCVLPGLCIHIESNDTGVRCGAVRTVLLVCQQTGVQGACALRRGEPRAHTHTHTNQPTNTNTHARTRGEMQAATTPLTLIAINRGKPWEPSALWVKCFLKKTSSAFASPPRPVCCGPVPAGPPPAPRCASPPCVTFRITEALRGVKSWRNRREMTLSRINQTGRVRCLPRLNHRSALEERSTTKTCFIYNTFNSTRLRNWPFTTRGGN